ncbi:hypothetical protein L1987_07945 [Smallanthus sonchifolius]|uniref:Uncharacterized protein n=1 Tax=Smallanthus sonchifolius TaxID=185202 RepID=A0ACB9JJP0_9ASTR|nr:hypothetical protein L1987_07945 [Smallanthus sonchifolius]
MDREQEQMQFLGRFGIFKESFKIIISCRKIFTQITLTLILPLTFIFLAHLEISNSLFPDTEDSNFEKDIIRPVTKIYINLSNTLSSKFITFWLFTVAYFTILFILSLLSTAAVVYTIASVYTGRELTFKKVMSVVPKVGKRLMVTFTCVFLAFLVYNLSLVLIIITYVKVLPNSEFVDYLFVVVFITYGMWFIYMTMMWQLASVVSVLESVYGFKAMTKSMNLIKGNREVATYIFFLLNISFALIQFSFESWVVEGRFLEAWKRVGLGVLCFILLLTLFLFGLVIQTILYLVCKSYHHENIDKGDLSNHLESYLGDYQRINGKQAVQLEQYHV